MAKIKEKVDKEYLRAKFNKIRHDTDAIAILLDDPNLGWELTEQTESEMDAISTLLHSIIKEIRVKKETIDGKD